MKSEFNVVLVGNPNSGKSSVFNQLTGLNQKVGNFPGVTVDKKTGYFSVGGSQTARVTDLPGLYSVYPNALDERISAGYILNLEAGKDLIVFVADATRLEKHMLLFTQLYDLGLPMILLLNMQDELRDKEITIDADRLAAHFQVPILFFNGRTGEGKEELVQAIREWKPFTESTRKTLPILEKVYKNKGETPDGQYDVGVYRSILAAHLSPGITVQNEEGRFLKNSAFSSLNAQIEETMARLGYLSNLLTNGIISSRHKVGSGLGADRLLVHPIVGPLIFGGFMLLVFQAIFSWSQWPMEMIEGAFGALSTYLSGVLPASWLTDLLTEGIIAGLGGVAVFIPQIAILFFLLSLLEESGYMARMVYLFDHIMQRFGLNGRSLVALISGGACAIPAIMSARTISNWKERLITIMVTPLISCSARIPIYTVMIGLLVPAESRLGWFNVQGLVFMGLYLTGIFGALGVAWLMKYWIKSDEPGFLALDLPSYRFPVVRNVFFYVKEKVQAFVVEAGKIILGISIVLWFLASYGPSDSMDLAMQDAGTKIQELGLDDAQAENLRASYALEASYAGHFGRWIEPVIEPLGYDWKIGIALLTSFAAREVFVGTMATIYSVGSEDESGVRQRLEEAVDPRTGRKVYTFATVLSLLVFYIFAMQCMSTVAVVKRETNSYKWPLIQFVGFTAMAYGLSFAVYQIAMAIG
jgi:ferrous iron transport protein B